MLRRNKPSSGSIRKRSNLSLDLSLTCVLYFFMMMFMGFAAVNTQANLLFGVFGLMFGILLVSALLSRTMLGKIVVSRTFPEHGVVGEAMTIFYEITNHKRLLPSMSLTIVELDGVSGFDRPSGCYMLHAAPGMTASVPAEVVPHRRGLHEFDHFQLSTSFPFGFVKRAVVDSCKDVICVYPALAEISPRFWEMCRSADSIGESNRALSGGEDEFYGVREYRSGDNPRHIYWRRSARTGVLVSKDMTRTAPPKIMILLDTRLPEATAAGAALVERAIAMAASIAFAGLEREFAVGLAAWAGRPIVILPARGKQHRDELLALLTRIESNVDFDARGLMAGREWMLKTGTTLALVTPGLEGVSAALSAGRGMLTLSASAPTTASLFAFRQGVTFDRPGAYNRTVSAHV